MTLADEGSHQKLDGNVDVVVDTDVDFLLFGVGDGASVYVDLDIIVWLL